MDDMSWWTPQVGLFMGLGIIAFAVIVSFVMKLGNKQ